MDTTLSVVPTTIPLAESPDLPVPQAARANPAKAVAVSTAVPRRKLFISVLLGAVRRKPTHRSSSDELTVRHATRPDRTPRLHFGYLSSLEVPSSPLPA